VADEAEADLVAGVDAGLVERAGGAVGGFA